MVTVFDMKTGRLIYQSHRADSATKTASRHVEGHPQPALQTLDTETGKASGMPPELFRVCPNDFLERWQR